MFFVIDEKPSKTFVVVLKKIPDHFKFASSRILNETGYPSSTISNLIVYIPGGRELNLVGQNLLQSLI